MPTYNEKRRHPSCMPGNMLRCRSNQSLNLLFYGSKSPSPAVSSLCLAQYASNGNLFESEMGSGHYDSDSPRSMSISSGAGSCSGKSHLDSTTSVDIFTYLFYTTLILFFPFDLPFISLI